MKFPLLTFAALALLWCNGVVVGAEEDMNMEHTTESPIADMALVESETPQDMGVKEETETKPQEVKADSAQPHTIADFIIHPLIALKPRVPEDKTGEGKQADSSTTPSPWQLFGFNAGQGLGSSVSSLAGSVTGWLGNRIQLPGLVDTPVRETSTTTSTTTTTTTPRPDVIVRLEHRPTTRRPNKRYGNRPNRYNNNNNNNNNVNNFEEYPDDDYFDVYDNNNNNFGGNVHDPDDDGFHGGVDNGFHRGDEEEDDEDDLRPMRQPNRRRRRPYQGMNQQFNNNFRRGNYNFNRRRQLPNVSANRNQKRRHQQRESQESEENQVEDAEEDDENGEENDQEFYYNDRSSSTKRSQNQQNFIQRGQQSLLNQIRQLTRSQTPSEVGSAIRKGLSATNSKNRRQQATLVINRNGQTIYMAPELLQSAEGTNQNLFYSAPTMNNKKRPIVGYPQPPLTVPYRRKGRPTQYITIPWSQLGISPPGQLVSVTEGIQSQPLILNIPQSAIEAMQYPKSGKKKTILTSEAVPLLAEASLMDVFKPPQIPHNRSPSHNKVVKKTQASITPVLITNKTKQRVRPGTIVEMSPVMDNTSEQMESTTQDPPSNENESDSGQYILVGEDGEKGLARHAFPILGETRQYASFTPYFNLFNGRQISARSSRQLKESEMAMAMDSEKSMDSSSLPESTNEKDTGKDMAMDSKMSMDSSSVPETEYMKNVSEMTSNVEMPMDMLKSKEIPMTENPSSEKPLEQIPVKIITSDLNTDKMSESPKKYGRKEIGIGP